MENTIVPCPRCRQPVAWHSDNPYRPFCSQSCKIIDLGDWASERYVIPSLPEADQAEH